MKPKYFFNPLQKYDYIALTQVKNSRIKSFICWLIGHEFREWKIDGDGVHLTRNCPIIVKICQRCGRIK